MKAILAVNNLGYIGLGDGLPWKCKEDFKHFKTLTLIQNKVYYKEEKIMTTQNENYPNLLVGYKTNLTLPPLKGRNVFVDLREWKTIEDINIGITHKRNQLIDIDWVIGGKKTYEKWCKYFTELHISYINDNTIGDTMFPDLRNLNPDCKIFKYFFEPNPIVNQ